MDNASGPCTHDNWYISGDTSIGYVTCPDCREEILLSKELFDREREKMQRSVKRMEDLMEALECFSEGKPWRGDR